MQRQCQRNNNKDVEQTRSTQGTQNSEQERTSPRSRSFSMEMSLSTPSITQLTRATSESPSRSVLDTAYSTRDGPWGLSSEPGHKCSMGHKTGAHKDRRSCDTHDHMLNLPHGRARPASSCCIHPQNHHGNSATEVLSSRWHACRFQAATGTSGCIQCGRCAESRSLDPGCQI